MVRYRAAGVPMYKTEWVRPFVTAFLVHTGTACMYILGDNQTSISPLREDSTVSRAAIRFGDSQR